MVTKTAGSCIIRRCAGPFGSIKKSSRVLRLEKETRNMPLLFPLVKVEVAVDVMISVALRRNRFCCRLPRYEPRTGVHALRAQ